MANCCWPAASSAKSRSSKALAEQREKGHRKLLGELLVEMGYCTENQIASALAEAYGVPYAQVSPKICDPKVVEILPREFLEAHIVLPLFRSTTCSRWPSASRPTSF